MEAITVPDRQNGSPQVWKHTLLQGVSANLAGGDSADAKPYQEREASEALRRLAEAQQRDGS